MKMCMISLILGLITFPFVDCFQLNVPRIAIVGGGIGGASTSYFLTQLLNESLEIDLYEAKTIGGRLATVKIDNNEVEAGGSVIHPRNMYMQKFVELLGLERAFPSSSSCSLWDGDKFVITSSSWSMISLTKLLYRYGFQIFKLYRYVNAILNDFVKIYDIQDAGKSFANVTAMLSAMNKDFPKLLQVSVRDHFLRMGFTEKLIDELIEATIVVNYGQDINIQSFVGLVSLAGAEGDLWLVKGGNKGVPEHLIYRNKKVKVIPGHVTKIRYIEDNSYLFPYEVTYKNKDSTKSMTSNYDIIIIATPLTQDQEFPIEFVDFSKNLKFPGIYHTTHATFITANLNPEYFGLQNNLDCILSCNPNKTIISSIGKLNSVNNKNLRAWKIFSRDSIETNIIHDMFSHVTEKKEIAWKAYPHYSTNTNLNNFKLHDALYHVNAIEWAASAMEMSAIAGRNVAILAYNDFLQKQGFTSRYSSISMDIRKKLFITEEL